jgi:hypothetical protein
MLYEDILKVWRTKSACPVSLIKQNMIQRRHNVLDKRVGQASESVTPKTPQKADFWQLDISTTTQEIFLKILQ